MIRITHAGQQANGICTIDRVNFRDSDLVIYNAVLIAVGAQVQQQADIEASTDQQVITLTFKGNGERDRARRFHQWLVKYAKKPTQVRWQITQPKPNKVAFKPANISPPCR